MSLVKWENSMRNVFDLKKEMDSIFDNFFGSKLPLASESNTFSPAIDLSETDNEIKVRVAVPNVDKKDIKISVAENRLTIKGETKKQSEEKKENYYKKEISYGSFSRTLSLPSDIKADKISAKLNDGILEILVPKSEKSKEKEVSISVE